MHDTDTEQFTCAVSFARELDSDIKPPRSAPPRCKTTAEWHPTVTPRKTCASPCDEDEFGNDTTAATATATATIFIVVSAAAVRSVQTISHPPSVRKENSGHGTILYHEGDDGLEQPETKDVLSSGSASPSSTHSLEGASPLHLVAATAGSATLLRNQTPQSLPSSTAAAAAAACATRQKAFLAPMPEAPSTTTNRSSIVDSSTTLMDPLDDVEHRIPATLIHDPSIER
ncbi:uncharacterized protein LOC131679535 [Topomyia yanbarensis]|uniref:uncharacterized protein LOC131679535 n=1 Tax=Topomyia yanbarensis TaxID=2498891 RepID=UPI00273AED1E|nr:uncharacterized protein LOC131679535 [Topomyia yanbarensis]